MKNRGIFSFSWQIYNKPLSERDNILKNIKQARKEYLGLLSIFNETPGNAYQFEAITYHLLAAEKLYYHWLRIGRENTIAGWPSPYSPGNRPRGIYFQGHWLPW